MKPHQNPFIRIAASLAFGIAPAAHAQVVNVDNQTFHYGTLLTDNFNTPSYNWWEFNNFIAADQGGTLATVAYSTSDGNGYTAQHSNGGNMLLTSDGWWGWGGMASPNHNFATTANTTNKPLEIQFDMSATGGDAPDWIGFGLNAGQGQLFYEGAYGFAATVGDGNHNYKLVISDTAGTGSGFNGITDGAKIEFYKDNVWQQTITETLGTSDGYITFRTIPSSWTGWNIGVVDNLKITSGQQTNPLATSTELNLSNNGSLNFGDVTQTVAKLDGTAGTTVKLLNSSLTVNGSGNSSFAGVISGSGGSLTKNGSGTLTLSGANTYSGATTITTGTLALSGSGSIANNSTVAVASGATLDVSAVTGGNWSLASGQKLTGAGGVTGATTIAGTHNAGDAATNAGVGSQAFSSSLTYADGSIFEWDINASSTSTGFDTVSAGGNIVVSTTGTVFKVVFGATALADVTNTNNAFWNTIPYGTQTWNMYDIFGQAFSSGAFQSVVTSTDVSEFGSFTITGTTLTWTAVPEPTSALAGLLLTAGLLRRRR
jgi:autotransporter-associated beta strand protein